jgi:hypothetical protein
MCGAGLCAKVIGGRQPSAQSPGVAVLVRTVARGSTGSARTAEGSENAPCRPGRTGAAQACATSRRRALLWRKPPHASPLTQHETLRAPESRWVGPWAVGRVGAWGCRDFAGEGSRAEMPRQGAGRDAGVFLLFEAWNAELGKPRPVARLRRAETQNTSRAAALPTQATPQAGAVPPMPPPGPRPTGPSTVTSATDTARTHGQQHGPLAHPGTMCACHLFR